MKKNVYLFYSFIFSLLILTSFLSCNDSNADSIMMEARDGVHFEKVNFEMAMRESKRRNKSLFLFAHAPYCSLCKKMKRSVFPEKKMGDFFNEMFVNVQVDVDSEEGENITRKFQIDHTPTFIFLDRDGNLISKTSGFENAEELIALAKSIQ